MNQGIIIRTADSLKCLAIKNRRPVLFCSVGFLFLIIVVLLFPILRLSMMQLINRLFEASEQANPYVYSHFVVGEDIGILPAAIVVGLAGLLLLTVLIFSAGALPSILSAVGLAVIQAYLGLSLPDWLNICLYLTFALLILAKHEFSSRLLPVCLCAAVVILGTILISPETDARIEAASEQVRDWFGTAFEQWMVSDTLGYQPQMEVRHENLRSPESGNAAALPGTQYQLINREEEQIALPHWVDYLRILLLCLLIPVALAAPFVPFFFVNRQQRKAELKRAPLTSGHPGEVIRCAFSLTNDCLEACHITAENALFMYRIDSQDSTFSKSYLTLYHQCVLLWQEAVYSDHTMTVEHQVPLLELLHITEQLCLQRADWRTRLKLKYVLCVQE